MRQRSCPRQLLANVFKKAQLAGAVWTAVRANIRMWRASNSLLTTELIGCIKTSLLLRLLSTWMWRRAIWEPVTTFSGKPASPSLGLILLPCRLALAHFNYLRIPEDTSTPIRPICPASKIATILFSSPGRWITRDVNDVGVTAWTPAMSRLH